MEYSQKLECMLEAVSLLHNPEDPITVRHLQLLKESVGYDPYAEGLVAGCWTGYLIAKGLTKELEENNLSVTEQIDVLIEYKGE